MNTAIETYIAEVSNLAKTGKTTASGTRPFRLGTGNIGTGNTGTSATLNQHCRVYINDTQYFDNVPERAWEMPIGGYQPAQKWLKDRKGRELTIDDIKHYQRIVVALEKTAEACARLG